jgi:hypothetical protein
VVRTPEQLSGSVLLSRVELEARCAPTVVVGLAGGEVPGRAEGRFGDYNTLYSVLEFELRSPSLLGRRSTT